MTMTHARTVTAYKYTLHLLPPSFSLASSREKRALQAAAATGSRPLLITWNLGSAKFAAVPSSPVPARVCFPPPPLFLFFCFFLLPVPPRRKWRRLQLAPSGRP